MSMRSSPGPRWTAPSCRDSPAETGPPRQPWREWGTSIAEAGAAPYRCPTRPHGTRRMTIRVVDRIRFAPAGTLAVSKMHPPELVDAVVVRVLAPRDDPERDVFVRLFLNLPRRRHPNAVPVHQQGRHHQRVVRLNSSRVHPLVPLVNRRQVQLPHHIHHEPRQMILRQPFRRRRWQQERLLRAVRPVCLRHVSKRSQPARPVDPFRHRADPSFLGSYARHAPSRCTTLATRR